VSVYVHPLVETVPGPGWRYKHVSHMIADTREELHALASQIGLSREWFQLKSTPHYDLTANKQKLAIKHGALLVSLREFVQTVQSLRAKKRKGGA